ncbi:MAG: DUF4139 domain-containing protein [Cyclobacteriaceae bacterium]|jgi:uncharacterized protein (TIGR02231 family)|nr:DUF4139 domain-containing protein [Cyclobacteriaceae bacterium]
MKKILLGLALLLAMTVHAQSEKATESKITAVTVFLNKAQVTREVKARVESGKTNLVVSGLTAQLDPQSIQVSGKGTVVILGISHRQNYLDDINPPRPLRVLRDSVLWYQRQISLEQSQKEILSKEEQLLLANQKIGGTEQNLTVAELKGMADFYRARLGEIVSNRLKQDEKIKMLNDRLARLNRQINAQNELYARNTSEIVISLSAEAATAVDLDVNYVVANAGWNAVYDVRAINTKNPVQLNYKANVYQSTGEEWKNVKLKLSTANPNQSGLKPELYTWYLDFYRPMPVNVAVGRGSQKRLSAPEMALDVAEKEEALQEVVVTSDYVQTVQTSLNTEFDIALPYTVASAAVPTVVDIRSYSMKADYAYSVAPKLDADAFLLARATGWEEFSLLPGEANIFFEGTFVGKSYIDPNSIKDTLAVSLGRDKRLVVKRDKLKDLTSRKTIGGSQKESYTWEISVRNTKSEAVTIRVEDHVPVSQNKDIEVTLLDRGNAQYNATSGKLTWSLTLAPNETRKVKYQFEVKYPKDRQVSGL